MRHIYTLLALILLSSLASHAQINYDLSAVEIHNQYDVAWKGIFKNSGPSESTFFDWYNKTYTPDAGIEWREAKRQLDKLGIEHVRFDQFYNDVAVNHGSMILHIRDGRVYQFNGEVYNGFEHGHVTSQAFHPNYSSDLDHINDTVNFENGKAYAMAPNGLPYLCDVINLEENGIVKDKIFVQNNHPDSRYVVAIEPQHIEIDVKGTANTHYIGVQDIIMDSLGTGSFRLRENQRPIRTFKASLGSDFTDTDNYFNNSGERIAGDVHYGAGLLHEMFDEKFGWDSYANNGDSITSVLNLNGGGNAFWNLSGNYATYLVRGSASVGPCAAIDVVGHELGHGVGDENAGLVYTGESCMLHESLGDINGTFLEWYFDSTKFDWILGDKVWNGGIRNMSDPKAFKHPDTYKGNFFPNGCHGSGGVQNYWFYLMVEGDTGTNDNNHSYSLGGLGWEKATQILYRAIFYYWTSNTNFADANKYALQAAKDIYGSCSEELKYTYDAWKAVGLEDTSFNIVDLSHGIIHPEIVCSVLPDTVRLKSFGDPNREVKWYFESGDSADTYVTDYIAHKTGSHELILRTEICKKVFWDTAQMVITYQPVAKFTVDDVNACNDGKDQIVLTNNSTNFDKTQALLFDWNVIPYDDHYYSKNLTFDVKDPWDLQFILKAYYQDGCWDTMSMRVNVHDIPVGTFTTKSSCEFETINIRNTTDTTDLNLEFTWTIDAWSESAFNPTKRVDSAGEYSVLLGVKDLNTGCENSTNGKVQIYPNPVPTFELKNACLGQTSTVINTTTHDVGANYFRWHLPTYKPFNKDTVQFDAPSTTAIIGLEYKDTRGCYAIVFDTVKIHDVSISISGPDTLCVNESGEFVALISPSNASVIWELNDLRYWNNRDDTIQIASANAGEYVVYGSLDVEGCFVMDSTPVEVFEGFEPDFVANDVCEGDTMWFDITAGKGAEYQWIWGDGTMSSDFMTYHIYELAKAGETESFTVQLVPRKTGTACVGSTQKTVTVNGAPDARFEYSHVGRIFNFTPLSQQAGNTYSWTFGDGQTSSLTSPTIQFDTFEEMSANLEIENNAGCKAETDQLIDGVILNVPDLKSVQIRIYPNPTSGVLHVDRSSALELHYQISDLGGSSLLDGTLTAEESTIDLKVPPGIYILRLENEASSISKRIVVLPSSD